MTFAHRRIVKEAQPNPVVVMFIEEGEHVFGLTALFEDDPILLALPEKRDVRADRVALRAGGLKPGHRQNNRACHKQNFAHCHLPSPGYYRPAGWRTS